MSCCDPLDTPTDGKATLTIALAGNPNSGKTTIFNALTGLRQKVANYPGVTVEKKTGRCKLPDANHGHTWADLIDLPGTYSLISRSPDETVAMEVLRGLRAETRRPDVVIVVVDASNLQRNLYLVSQLIELGRPLVVALNMMDVAERRGIQVSPATLEKTLGVPVIPVVGYKKKGIDELKRAVARAAVAPLPNWPLPEAMREELMIVGGGLAILGEELNLGKVESGFGFRVSGFGEKTEGAGFAISFSGPDTRNPTPDTRSPTRRPNPETRSPPRAWICRDDSDRRLDRYQALAERLLIGDRAADVAPVAAREPVASLLAHASNRLRALGIDPMQADVEAHYRWIESVAKSCTTGVPPVTADETDHGQDARVTLDYAAAPTLSERADRIMLHKVWGLLIFAAIMGALFVSVFWVAQPLMDGIQSAVKWLGNLVAAHMSEGPVKALITDGIFAGVGTVLVFVPQIAMLFMFISILEDTGYLARAAFLMDRLLAKVGLHGKSFIPLLSSFACAIPGIMATRTIENRKDRLATIFIAPFMSCSARLPVYALLIGTFFASFSAFTRGGIMLACYALGILAAVATAWVFKRTMLKGAPASFILELPTYKIPQASQVVRQVWVNTSEFVKKAGTTIFCLSVILWAMTYYPRLSEQQTQTAISIADKQDADKDLTADSALPLFLHITKGEVIEKVKRHPELINPSDAAHLPEFLAKCEAERKANADIAVASYQRRNSIAGRFGHLIEPAIRPLGFDWKMGVGLVGAFAAREVFVSTMAITYAAGDEDNTADLASAMRADQYPNGKPVWTPLVALSLLVWFVLAMQCMSTIAIVKRETGGWRWPIAMLVYMNVLAYVVSLAVFQIGRIWFA